MGLVRTQCHDFKKEKKTNSNFQNMKLFILTGYNYRIGAEPTPTKLLTNYTINTTITVQRVLCFLCSLLVINPKSGVFILTCMFPRFLNLVHEASLWTYMHFLPSLSKFRTTHFSYKQLDYKGPSPNYRLFSNV